MHAVTRHYTFDPDSRPQISRSVREAFLPFIREVPGFVAYYWIETGPGSATSVTVFDDPARAEASTSLALGFALAEMGDVLGEPEVSQGPVTAHGLRPTAIAS